MNNIQLLLLRMSTLKYVHFNERQMNEAKGFKQHTVENVIIKG